MGSPQATRQHPGPTLALAPPYRSEEERALLNFAKWWRRQYLDRSLLTVVAGVHLWAAVTLAFAPDQQLFTEDVAPMFDLAPPLVWAVAFAVGGAAAFLLLLRLTPGRQWATWLTVIPTQLMWSGAAVLAAGDGDGSALAVLFLGAVLAFTSITALYLAAEFASGKR